MTEPSDRDRDRELVDSYLGIFLDYEKRMWPNSAVCVNARDAALMLVAAVRAESVPTTRAGGMIREEAWARAMWLADRAGLVNHPGRTFCRLWRLLESYK